MFNQPNPRQDGQGDGGGCDAPVTASPAEDLDRMQHSAESPTGAVANPQLHTAGQLNLAERAKKPYGFMTPEAFKLAAYIRRENYKAIDAIFARLKRERGPECEGCGATAESIESWNFRVCDSAVANGEGLEKYRQVSGQREQPQGACGHPEQREDGAPISKQAADRLAELAKNAIKERDVAREALTPFVEWLRHIVATGSRPLSDSEYPPVSGMPRMAALRDALAALSFRADRSEQ